ncbi:anti-sigma factor [Streptomyces microflavus]|uniref:anti-sigma factor n=1 Tax=Streptomyces microflavus TaxID=1919 RepID=UPI0033AA7E78
MQHSDLNDLALLALGDAPSKSVAAHVHECDRCARELADLRRVIEAGRGSELEDLVEPPPEVWSAICAELNLDLGTAAGSEAASDPEQDSPTGFPTSRTGRIHPLPLKAYSSAAPDAERNQSGKARGRRTVLAVAAAAALLGAAAGSGITWWTVDRSPQPVVAGTSRPLTALVPSALGSARIGESSGQLKLDIKVEGLPKTSGYFEVWLMDRSHTRLISMGILGPQGHAVLPVPENVDLDDYSFVDVSVQEYNGSPAHSGNSIVRGEFAGT